MKNNYLFLSFCSSMLAIFGYHYYNTNQMIESEHPHGHYCAVQATPDVRTFEQADGSSFVGFIKGTRAAHYIETKDGYTVLKDKNGFYKYAISTNDGDLAITDIVVREIGQRTIAEKALLNSIDKNLRYTGNVLNAKLASSPAATSSSTPELVFPSTGTRKALLLLVDFPDQLATYSIGDFDNLANQTGYNVNGQTGSFRDYYQDISYGALTINTDLQGWYTAPNNKATYGDNQPSSVTTDLVRFAVDEAEAAGTDFSQYDGDGDGKVDVVMVIHSGRGAEESGNGDDIWSHRWSLNGGGNAVTYDGVLINDYIIQAEKYGATNITNIGVLCHEFGHALGLPDLYDTDGSSSGVSSWCLMAGGTWNNSGRTPAQMSAWCKKEMGWMNPTVLTNDNTIVTDMDYSDNSAESYRLNTPVSNEYFLIENRQKQGWDAYLPSEGLAVWHIDDNKNGNSDETHRLVDLEAADGSDNGSLFPGATNNTTFNDISTPNAMTYSGVNSNFCLSNISENGNFVSFQFDTSCFPSFCNDGTQSGDETGVDCGGSCPDCVCQSTTIAAPSMTSGLTLGNGNNCDLRGSEDTTYEFTVPTDGLWTISTCNSTDFDTYLLLGTTCCSNNISENDNSTGCNNGSSSIMAELTANTTYYVTIEGMSDEMAGMFELEIIPPACMIDDMMIAPFSTTGTTAGMGNNCDPNTGSAVNGNAEDVILEIEILNDGIWEFSLDNSDYDTYLFLGSTCCSMDIAFDDDSGAALTSKITQELTAGVYYLTIDGWSTNTGNYALDVYEIACSDESTFEGDYCAGDGSSITVGNTVFDEANPIGTVTLTNSQNCDSVVNVNLTFHSIITAIDIVNPTCFGDVGSLTILATSNTSTTYEYAWNTGETTQTIAASAGFYSVVVTDEYSCITTNSVMVSEPNEITTVTAAFDASCGQNNGEAIVSVNGGTYPYTFLWNDANAQTNDVATGLAAGNYEVIITDANGCATTAPVTVNNIDGPSIVITSIDATCSQNNGEAISAVDGGMPPYSYIWSDANAQTNDIAFGLDAGNYTVTVTDANNCTATSSIDIFSTETSTPTNITEYHCAGSGYSLTIGTDVFDEMNPTGTVILTNVQNCDSTINISLNFSTPNIFTAPFSDAGTTVGMGNSCDPNPTSTSFGNAEDALYEIEIPNDGTWEFSLAGSDYDTQLFLGTSCCMSDVDENDDEDLGNGIFTSKIIVQLTAGTYFLTVDGWSSNTGNYNLVVSEVLCATPVSLSATWINENTATYDWEDISGAIAYEFQEKTQADSIWNVAMVNVSESPNIIPHLPNTNYQWQVRTVCENGLYSDWSPIQTFYSRANLTASFTNISNVNCPSGNDGGFTVTITGGLAPYQYSLNGVNYQEGINGNATISGFSGLTAGSYFLQVIDAAGDTVDVVNPIDGSNEVIIQDGIYSLACEYCTSYGNNSSFDHIGTVDFNTIFNESGDDGGYGNYTNLNTDVVMGEKYDISLTPIITFANDIEFWNVWIDYNQDFVFTADELALQTEGSSLPIDSMITISPNAIAGATMMRVQMKWNANAATPCDTIPFGEVEDYTIIIHEPLNATVSNIKDARCPNGEEGSFQLNITGGIPPFAYSIDNGSTFQTANNFNSLIENMSAGTYQVFVQDIEGTLITASTADGLNYFEIQDGEPSFACNYCRSEGRSTEYEYIQLVHFADINHSSANDNGYGDFTNISTSVMAGDTYDITLAPFVALPEGFEYWSVWIDYNGDYTFSPDELALQTEGTLDIVNASITIPNDAVAGTTLMRVQMKWGNEPTTADACQIFDFGEVEDFSIVIEQVCDAPTNLNVLDPTPSSVTFDWDDVADAVGYRFREREIGNNNWITADVFVSETPNLITHTSNTTYEWQVRTDCGNGNVSDWSALETFVSPTADCAALSITDLNTIISTSNGLEVTLEWMPMPNAQAYQLAGRKQGGNTKVFPETQLTSRSFSNGSIAYNTTYQWSVRVKCDGAWTEYVLPPASFTTPSPAGKNQEIVNDIFDTNESLTAKVYPNPTNNEVTVSVNTLGWENDIHIAILDMTGRIIIQEKTNSSETTLNISHLNEGYYFVRTENAGAVGTTKLVVMK